MNKKPLPIAEVAGFLAFLAIGGGLVWGAVTFVSSIGDKAAPLPPKESFTPHPSRY